MSELTAKENIKTADTVKRITATAVMAALTTLMTAYIFHIPVGVNGGYVHLGDTMIYLAAAFLPLPYACAAGAIGGGLADLWFFINIYFSCNKNIAVFFTYFFISCSNSTAITTLQKIFRLDFTPDRY